MQWPRAECPDPDRGLVTVSALQPILSDFVPYDSVPKAVVQAKMTAQEIAERVRKAQTQPAGGVSTAAA